MASLRCRTFVTKGFKSVVILPPLLSWVPSYLHVQPTPNLNPLRRLFISLKTLGFRNTPNFLQTGSAFSAPGLVRPLLSHILWGRDPSSHKCMGMRR